MNSIQLLQEQFNSAHHTQEATISDASKKALHFNKTSKALPAGAAYAHSVLGEDIVLSTMLMNKKPLSSSKTAKTGLSQPMPPFDKWDQHEKWARTVKVDLPVLQVFAKKVYKQTDGYLKSLKEKDLEKVYDMTSWGMGKQTVGFVINNFLLLHIANLTGEMSAAKGFQGLKGYPF